MVPSIMVSKQLEMAHDELERLNSLREEAIKLSRKWLSLCRNLILKAREERELNQVEGQLRSMIEEVNEFLRRCTLQLGYLDTSIRSLISDPLQEAVEGIVLARLLQGMEIPGHKELNVGPREYVLGIGDVVGELRRVALHLLLEGRISDAEKLVSYMSEIYENLNSMIFPDSLLPVRRKADVARSLIEKTLSEIIMMKASVEVRRDE